MNTEHFDVLIVGAGLSGIGMACHLHRQCPDKRYAILEARKSLGGTWDLFRYPGVRADSDIYTLSYPFQPWKGSKEIADGQDILDYLRETAKEHRIDERIRYGYAVQKATWSTEDAAWTVEANIEPTGETVLLSCNMLIMCAGYYSYEAGHMPSFSGQQDFRGKIVHPQQWPQDLDYSDQRVIVIGSGATAVSMVPVLAEDARHVVMLQRSPTYMMARPEASRLGRFLRKCLPARAANAIGRWWNQTLSQFFYRRSRTQPRKVRRFLLHGISRALGPHYDVEKHFGPSYDPWDQRLCLVRNGDLFAAIRSGKVTMVTDHIDRFTEDGVLTKSGEAIPADLVVTATGLELKMLGGMQVVVDGREVNLAETFTYKGMMSSDVPNLISVFGYINASWTLRLELIAEFTCRLVSHMDASGFRQCTPRLRDSDCDMVPQPFIADFSSNYLARAMHCMPRQGDREPWVNTQDYRKEVDLIRDGSMDDDCLIFTA